MCTIMLNTWTFPCLMTPTVRFFSPFQYNVIYFNKSVLWIAFSLQLRLLCLLKQTKLEFTLNEFCTLMRVGTLHLKKRFLWNIGILDLKIWLMADKLEDLIADYEELEFATPPMSFTRLQPVLPYL